MQISVAYTDPTVAKQDYLAVGVFFDDDKSKMVNSPIFDSLDKALGKALSKAAKDYDFSGKTGQTLVLDTLGGHAARRIAILGLGSELDQRTLLTCGARAVRGANKCGAKSAGLVIETPPGDSNFEPTDTGALTARGAFLGTYRYDQYRSKPGRKHTLSKLKLFFPGGDEKAAAKRQMLAAIKGAVISAEGVAIARDLVNEPAADLYPETFAKQIKSLSRGTKLKVKVFGKAQLQKMGHNLHLSVGMGSVREPRLVHMTYTPTGAAAKKRPLVLVGKGITFDSGGLCLKPAGAMNDMKVDMAGAAAVVGAMVAIGKLAPKQPVHGIVALAENMPAGNALKLGDVIRAASGKTVEINNTDAEGRLVLADALHYANKLKPTRIIDLATLTGACMVALGPNTTGVFATDDELADDILSAAEATGEDFWRLPLTSSLKTQLKSDIADIKNTGERWGGAITAGLFLSEFVGHTPWAHLDIAGPASTSTDAGILRKGGTGVAVATILRLAGV